MVQEEINRRGLRERAEVSQSEKILALPREWHCSSFLTPLPFLCRQQYPHSIVRLQWYRGSPLLQPDFQIRCEKRKTHSENTHTAREELGRGGPADAALGPLRGGEGMRAPPEVPQSRRGRKGRASSGRPRPLAAVTAPARAPPPPPRCQAASPSHRVGAAAARAPHLPGPRCSRRGERGSRNLLSASGGHPCTGGRPRNGGGPLRTPAQGRRVRPRSALPLPQPAGGRPSAAAAAPKTPSRPPIPRTQS